MNKIGERCYYDIAAAGQNRYTVRTGSSLLSGCSIGKK